MARPTVWALTFAVIAVLAFGAETDAATTSNDPAARGLDVLVHMPDRAAPRATLPLQIEAFGFPVVTRLVPLAGAEIEAVWDPESLGPDVHEAPPPVKVTADASGRAHLDVPVPDGEARTLSLLVGIRSGDHRRTRVFEVMRERPYEVTLRVADRRVVPGSNVSAWVLVTNAATGAPVPSLPISLRLLEGGLARSNVALTTDAAGTAMGRVSIPWTEEPSWSWQLEARTASSAEVDSGLAWVRLSPREETPGSPTIVALWADSSVKAGDRATFRVRVRDAVDKPVASLPVRYWIGPKGTTPPEEEEDWLRLSTRAMTDASGEIVGAHDAPTTVVANVGTTLTIVARAEVEGHELKDDAVVRVEAPAASADLLPEAGAIIPGASQRVLLRMRTGRGEPIVATFSLEGDGLSERVTTNDAGEAEVTWKAPVDLGGLRNVGPCAGGVASSVVVRWEGDVPALADRRAPFELCLPVDRDVPGVVRVEPPHARAGDAVRVRIESAGPNAAWSVMLRSDSGSQSASAWIEKGEVGGEVRLPEGASGVWTVSAVAPSLGKAARVIGGAVMVTPRVLPKLTASVVSGRAAPGGSVDVDIDLKDDKGQGLPGTVAAFVVDLHGGGRTYGLTQIDTRGSLCASVGVYSERCDRFLEGDASLDPLRRAVLGSHARRTLAPANDPGGMLDRTLRRAFSDVVRSLEGAVFEATESADRLRDVRRKGKSGFDFNPELMTLVTAAMDPKPLTPGGEPLVLGDLIAIDPQVDFDNVARRVTRLKLFQILTAVRQFRHEHLLDADEPALRDPNALLRKLVREQRIAEDLLLDPWGGTIQFTRASGPPLPFLTVSKNFELHAPGPDGRLATRDDVRDPFERVLKSGTPYATAVQEDRVVDAKLDMEVGDATVDAWAQMFAELTGSALGSGIGLGSIGTVGHGSGTGSGQGFGSGHGRMGVSSSTGDGYWSAPQRTDDKGHLRMRIPLGDVETTYRIGLVGVPDRATPAAATVDVPVSVPLSAKIDAGVVWAEGDEVDVRIAVRNRGKSAISASLAIEASAAAQLVDPRDKSRTTSVPADGVSSITVRVRAKVAGTGVLKVTTQAPGVASDVLTHEWEVRSAGELVTLVASRLVEGEETLDLTTNQGAIQRIGKPHLVIERGEASLLSGALDSMDPDRLTSPDALADAVEVGTRVERFAIAHEGERSALAVQAGELSRRALGRLAAYRASSRDIESVRWAAFGRAQVWARPSDAAKLPDAPDCPPEGSPTIDAGLDGLDAEPPPAGGGVRACWDAFVAGTTQKVTSSGDPVAIARAVLGLIEKPHRIETATALIDRLRERVSTEASGAITLPPGHAADRSSRAIVYAALLRARGIGKSSVVSPARLSAWLAVQRDATGGYGSALATRQAVRALLAMAEQGPAADKPSQVVVTAEGFRREVTLSPSERQVITIDGPSEAVTIEVKGPALLARLERLAVRRWSSPPDTSSSPVHLDVKWPAEPHAGKTGVLRVSLRHDLGRATTVDARIPLPPGVTLAESAAGVRQIQGVLAIRSNLGESMLPTTLEIPLRFSLAGRVTVPEARARRSSEEARATVAPARSLVVR